MAIGEYSQHVGLKSGITQKDQVRF